MRNYFKTLFPFFCAIALLFLPLNNKISAADIPYISTAQSSASDSSITPQSDDIGWRYKTVNGKLYKRLYNYSTNQWIGDWILVP